jgi:hypothetical protein
MNGNWETEHYTVILFWEITMPRSFSYENTQIKTDIYIGFSCDIS